jgi:hypothetical protein
MSKPVHCESCGYTEADAKVHGDHRLCKNAGNAPWEVRRKSKEKSTMTTEPGVPLTFNYSAMIVQPSNGMQAPTWMVKRWTDDPADYTESLIAVHTNAPESAIAAAIERGSWA